MNAYEFRASDIERLFIQDQLVVQHGLYPYWPSKDIRESEVDEAADGSLFLAFTPSFEIYKLDLGQLITDLRNAVLLPFSDEFLAWLHALLSGAEQEARAQLRRKAVLERRRREYGPSDWASANLLAEVEAVCGPGRKSGEYWFKCPFHEDRSPSLEVNAEKRVWHCWGCGKAGGVVDWRRTVG